MPFGAVLNTGTIRGYEGPVNEVPDNKQERFQALHHMFLASAKVVKYAHEHYPNFKIGDMNIFATSYPLTSDPDDVIENQQHMNISNWFCSDVQVRGEYPFYMHRYFEENGTRGTLTSWISSILAEQNETFKNRYIELKKLKLRKVSKTGNEITIIYNASLQAPAGLPSQADLLFHFLDGVSESKPVNEMFSYISRYVTAREQTNK